MAGKIIFTFSVVIVSVFAISGIMDRLPGQSLLPLRVSGVQIKEVNKTSLLKLNVQVMLDSRNFSGGTPAEVVLLVQPDDEECKEWQVAYADIHEYVNGVRVPAPAVAVPHYDPRKEEPTKIEISGLLDGPRYIVTIFFKPNDQLKNERIDIQKKKAEKIRLGGGFSITLNQ